MAVCLCDSAQARSAARSELEVWIRAEGPGERRKGCLVGVGLLKANTLMNQQWHLINV